MQQGQWHGTVAWPSPHCVSWRDEGYLQAVTAHTTSACAVAPVVDVDSSLTPANDIISKEAGSDLWFPIQAATELISPFWEECI